MKKSLIALAVLALSSSFTAGATRARTRDISYQFRMGAGFPGDVNRTHPASILPVLMTPVVANKARLYGDPVLIDPANNAVRGFIAGDTATVAYGFLVRPYPTQQTTGGMASALGNAGAPDGPAVVDVLREGYMIAKCNNFATVQPRKGDPVYVRIAATAGPLLQGGLSSAADGANTLLLTNVNWVGPTDSAGVTEIEMRAA